MKAFSLALFPFIVASFVGCLPPVGFPNLVPQPQNVGQQLDFLHGFAELFLNDNAGHCAELQHHFEEHGVEGVFANFCEDLGGLVGGAVEFHDLLVRPHEFGLPGFPGDNEGGFLHHVGAVLQFLQGLHDGLLHLLHDLEGHLHEGLKVNDEEAATVFVGYGFPVDKLADVCVNDVKGKLKAFLGEGQPLNKVLQAHAVGLTLMEPYELGQKLLWLHEFALAVAKNEALEAALLEQLNDVPTGKEVVEAVKELGADDGVLHKVVVDKCCGDAFTCERAIRYTAFDEGQAGRYLGILIRLTFMSVRMHILEAAVKIKTFCPFQAGQDFPVELLECGQFTMDQVKCEPGKFVAVDGPLAKIEDLLKGKRQQLIHDIAGTFEVK
ncbi:hypothetical protein BgAZ_404880 [Babesia gibsoni]|uniref:Uncharacterized protein n=1 Tax=Babesia gibsoni TaxID=33632 RepID=A0AAD8PCT1_BABGI|nr:hypothetical protein BgAZ_404880 [Babesia gibsoni]